MSDDKNDNVALRIVSERLRKLRKKTIYNDKPLTREKLSEELSNQYGLSISDKRIGDYERADLDSTAVCGMKTETLYTLAKFYNVSSDYILGLTEAESPNISTRAIQECTGLSEHAADMLTKCEFAKPYSIHYPKLVHILNIILSSKYGVGFIENLFSFIFSEGITIFGADKNFNVPNIKESIHIDDDCFIEDSNGDFSVHGDIATILDITDKYGYEIHSLYRHSFNGDDSVLHSTSIKNDFWESLYLKEMEQTLIRLKDDLKNHGFEPCTPEGELS